MREEELLSAARPTVGRDARKYGKNWLGMWKLETILRFGATTLRDKILDETLNKHAERYDGDLPGRGHGGVWYETLAQVVTSCGLAEIIERAG